MTMIRPDFIRPDDLQRAAALLSSYATGDLPGLNLSLQEADEDNRISLLLLAVLTLVQTAAPPLFAPENAAIWSAAAAKFAQAEPGDDS
jgi:hypothetical protein